MPSYVMGLSPLEIFTSSTSDQEDLKRAHVFGSTVYILDPKLQNGKKIPKWNRRSRRGQFLGFSPNYSFLISMVRNLRTGHMSPHFHVVHDDIFKMVANFDHVEPLSDGAILDEILESHRE